MSIGYACLIKGKSEIGLRTCTKEKATLEHLMEIMEYNISILEQMIEYNHENKIFLFRISSDLIPFGSSPINTLNWWDLFEEKLLFIGDKIKSYQIRVSMHPGQYTILNSIDAQVVNKSILDLNYHAKVLDALGLDKSHKLILHIGGVYGNKTLAIKRFIDTYHQLSLSVRDRLVIENDDKLYTIEDVLEISNATGAPVVFDNLHHQLNPSVLKRSDAQWIHKCAYTWKKEDGKQKVHYSQQDLTKKTGSHSARINIEEFLDFYEQINPQKVDIMLEVKDKNWSAMKCILATVKKPAIKGLEQEWSRYKYLVLEHSPLQYQEIRNLLKQKTTYPVVMFYEGIDTALEQAVEIGHGVNAAEHVWGYFRNQASEKEQKEFKRRLTSYQEQKSSLESVKKYLWKMTEKYQDAYLQHSYYFTGIMEKRKS